MGAMQFLAENQQQLMQDRQSEQSCQSYAKFVDSTSESENTFRAMMPDYDAAAEHIEQSRRNELKQLLPDNDPQSHLLARQNGCRTPEELRNKIFVQDAQNVAQNALRRGINPAKAYYDLAVQRGYQAKGGGRGQTARTAKTTSHLADLYTSDPEAFDKQWEKMARTGALG